LTDTDDVDHFSWASAHSCKTPYSQENTSINGPWDWWSCLTKELWKFPATSIALNSSLNLHNIYS